VIPSSGWLPEANNQNSGVTTVPLAAPFDATYTDVVRDTELPKRITSRPYSYGAAALEKNPKAAAFTVRLRWTYIYDVVLVDRIE
jgi:hypothetical protein